MTPEQIEQLEQQRCVAMVAGDIAALDGLFDDELLWTHSSGKVDTRRSLLAQLSDGSVAYLAIDRSNVTTRVFGWAAVVTGTVEMNALAGGAPRKVVNRYCAIWSSYDGQHARLVNWLSARAD